MGACACELMGRRACCARCAPGRDKVELLLSMGANRMEASRDVVQRAVSAAWAAGGARTRA